MDKMNLCSCGCGTMCHLKWARGHNQNDSEQRQKHFEAHHHKCLLVWEHELHNEELLKGKLLEFANLEKENG